MRHRTAQAAAIAFIVATAVVKDGGASLGWITAAFAAFGIVNVLLDAPGTFAVRGSGVLVALVGIQASNVVGAMFIALLLWLAWPPAYMAAWAANRETPGAPEPTATRARIALAVVIGAVAIASIAYRLIHAHGLEQTAALFVGLPAIIAIVVVLGVSPGSAVGVACKAVTVGLLVSLIFLWEGVLCVMMSAPLFYAVAVMIASAFDWARHGRHTTTISCVVVVAVVPMTLEGVTPATTIDRRDAVRVTKVVHAPAEAITRALFEPPRFDRVRPWHLDAAFPTPVSSRIERHGAATRWVVEMRGGEMFLNGMEPATGDLVLDLVESRSGYVHWRAVSDSSHMTHFLIFREAVVEWTAIDATTTRVTWTLGYDRQLDPAWYFGPIERVVSRLAAGYLIDAVAAP